jgi:flagellar motor switch protein FliN
MSTTTLSADSLATAVTSIGEAVAAAMPSPLEAGFASTTGDNRTFASVQLGPTARAVRMHLVGPQDVIVTVAVATRAADAAEVSAPTLAAGLEPAFAAAAGSLDPTVFGALSLASIEEVTVDTPPDSWALPLEDAQGVAAVVLLTTPSPAEPEPEPQVVAAPLAAPTATHEFPALATPAFGSAVTHSLNMLHDVEMAVTVELGRTRMTVREILGLAPGTVVELDRAAGAPVDVVVNGTLIARGEVVVIDEEFGIRVTEIVSNGEDKR